MMPEPHAWDPQPAKFDPRLLPTRHMPWVAPSESIFDIAMSIRRAEDERLEALVMTMLADPRRPGIAVIEHDMVISLDRLDDYENPRYVAEQCTEMRLDTNVPDANIFRFPSHEAYGAWVERGCPTTTTEEPS